MFSRWLYTLLLILISPLFVIPLFKKNNKSVLFQKRWQELLGITPKLSTKQKPIWVHAVSVGESIAAIPLVKSLKQHFPEEMIVVTTTTSTGAEQIAKLGDLVEHRFMPLDFPWFVQGFLNSVKPKQLLIIETELWPNTLATVHANQIPISVVNARLSEKSMSNYLKIKPLFKTISSSVDQILCQTETDQKRFANLGVAAYKLHTTGSLKFDINVPDDALLLGKQLREQFGQRPIWIAASTHDGEDKYVLNAHKEVLHQYPNALLIIVPRHPERFKSVVELSQKMAFNTIARSSQQLVTQDTNVYIGDTMGEMFTLLKAADICFMGGSLLGSKVGGHNLLEPTAIGIPSLTGPSYFNFKDITEALINEGITKVIADSLELANEIQCSFSNSSNQLLPTMQAFMHKHQGALSKTLVYIENAKNK